MEYRQIQWNSLLMGDGTPYLVQSVSGLHDTPSVRTGRRARARRHGTYPGSKYLDARTITATVEIDGDHQDGLAVWDDFSRAHVVADPTIREWRAKVPGLASGREILIFATCERLALPVDQDYMAGVGHADVQWVADDPLIYDAELQTVGTSVSSSETTGEPWPWEWPIDWGGSSTGGSFTAVNEGEYDAPWIATLAGPLTNPRITHADTGQEMRFDASIGPGETLVIDSREQTILHNGTQAQRGWLRPQSEWFDLQKGPNRIRFAAASGAGSIQLEFRSAWI